MIFNSFIFLFAFLPVAFIVYWLLRGKQVRYLWLTAMSYIFYGYWNWRFIFLMLLVTTVDFALGLFIDRAVTSKKRKILLSLSIITNLGLLGFFKYFNFGLDALRIMSSTFGLDLALPILSIILPVGISFYTFQSMSYTIDIYRKQLSPTKNFLEFACFVSLFPQLVAGPIVRFREIVSDLENIDKLEKSKAMHKGINFFVIGLAKKVLLADSIALIINPMFNNYALLGTVGAWLAVLGYTYQLYFDFSGYSDMAVGLGYLFGFRFPQNFNSPYKAINISDFWRRWHISLSTWLRDYLYIPLGGSRLGNTRTYVNLLLTMLLGGLWHGANWTFVVWGGYHGALLALYKAFQKQYDQLPVALQKSLTFLLVIIGWVFFRSTDFSMANSLLRKMFNLKKLFDLNSNFWLATFSPHLWLMALLTAAFLLAHFTKNTFEIRWKVKLVHAALLGFIFVLALIFMNYKQSVFLYYQF